MRKPFLFKAFVALLIMASCNQMSTGQSTKTLAVNDFEKKLNETKDAQLVDVRTPEEYAEKHLNEAVNLNFNADDFLEKIDKLDKSKPVFVYCLSGGRSGRATALMSKKGFKEIYNLDGGILAWTEAKKIVVTPGSGGAAKGLTMDDYLAQVKSDKLVLVDFNAVWCGPCKQLKPKLDRLADKYKSSMTLLPLDVDKNPMLSSGMHISSIPLMIMYKGGKEVWRNLGDAEEKTIENQIVSNSK